MKKLLPLILALLWASPAFGVASQEVMIKPFHDIQFFKEWKMQKKVNPRRGSIRVNRDRIGVFYFNINTIKDTIDTMDVPYENVTGKDRLSSVEFVFQPTRIKYNGGLNVMELNGHPNYDGGFLDWEYYGDSLYKFSIGKKAFKGDRKIIYEYTPRKIKDRLRESKNIHFLVEHRKRSDFYIATMENEHMFKQPYLLLKFDAVQTITCNPFQKYNPELDVCENLKEPR